MCACEDETLSGWHLSLPKTFAYFPEGERYRRSRRVKDGRAIGSKPSPEEREYRWFFPHLSLRSPYGYRLNLRPIRLISLIAIQCPLCGLVNSVRVPSEAPPPFMVEGRVPNRTCERNGDAY